MYVHDTRLKFYFEATPGFWSLENLLRRKVTPMAKRMRKSPVVFTICASVLFATYCKLQTVNSNIWTMKDLFFGQMLHEAKKIIGVFSLLLKKKLEQIA